MTDEHLEPGAIGYWTEHQGHTGQGSNRDPDPCWQATCKTCGWLGARNPRTEEGWQATVDELNRHRDESRAWVPVEPLEEDGVVYAVEDASYDCSGLRDVYRSLYLALADNPFPWGMGGDGYWIREDGDAIKQTAMSITRVEVR